MIVFVGPVFFSLLKSTLESGTIAGLLVAFGIFISDVVCVALCSLGAIPFFKNSDNQFWIAALGAIILLGMGIKYVIKPSLNTANKISLNTASYLSFFTQGFLVNFVNPFVFLVWIGVIGYGENEYGFSIDLAIFLSAALLGILTTDVSKVFLAQHLKKFIQPKTLKILYRSIGVILIAFGIRMVWYCLGLL